jgi:hypothetical protein
LVTASDLNYNLSASAEEMAEEIFGPGVTVLSASYSGDSSASGIFSGGDTIAPGATPADTGVILSTGRADDYTNASGEANQSTSRSTDTSGQDGTPDFDAAAGASTFDASYLDVSFIPDAEVMTMQFIFSSEEFPEYQSSVYQDVVSVWVNGEQVQLELGSGTATPDNVSSTTNQNFYLDNATDAYNTEMDGLTVTMTLTMNVNPDEVNTLRIGIADVGDSVYDSNLLIAGDSVQTNLVAQTDMVHVRPTGSKTIDVLENDLSATGETLSITHLNGLEVVPGSMLTLDTGQEVTLNADGTLTLTGDGDVEDFAFTYTVSDGKISDTGLVNATSIPCFVAGTMIRTPHGDVPVETLQPGDLVVTRDEGPQPVRWIGSRSVAGQGNLAPIHLVAGTFGAHGDLKVSPQHRVLVRGAMAELLFGEAEVLVAARDLINDCSVRRHPCAEVCYVHLMFDRHQIVYSQDLPSESFLPGPKIKDLFERQVLEEICALFPDLDPETGEGYGAAARPTLSSREARLLAQAHAI